jgi:hypothetical protein
MKRYLVFCGDSYYPSGGINDFVGDAETRDEYLAIVSTRLCDWWHVYDTVLRRKVEWGIKS